MTNGRAVFVALVSLFLLGSTVDGQGVGGRARIVWPERGGALYFNGAIEVELEGLGIGHFSLLETVVETRDWPKGNPVKEGIVLWEGSPFIPVVPGGGPSAGGCAWVNWIDRVSGRAVLRVVWNHFEPGFRRGEYEIRVHVRVRSPDGQIWTWGQTDWYRVHLVPEESPRIAVSLTRPRPEEDFGLGESIVVAGVAGMPVVPIRVRLEVKLEGLSRWEAVAQNTFYTSDFELVWIADGVTLGRHDLRVCVADARGAVGESAPVAVRVVPRRLRIQLLTPKQGAEVRVGEPVRVQAQVLGAVPPVTVTIESRLDVEGSTWDVVKEMSVTGPDFEWSLDTGQYGQRTLYLRVRARDTEGSLALTDEVRIVLRAPRLRILMNGSAAEVFEVKANEPVQFELDVEETVAWGRFVWEFGDGGKSEQKAPMHSFSTAGTYNVRVTAYQPEKSPLQASVTVVVTARKAVEAVRRIVGYPCPCRDGGVVCEGTAVVVYRPKAGAASVTRYAARVETVITVLEPVTGVILTENVPTGWVLEPLPEGSDYVRVNRLGPVPTERGLWLRWSWVVTSAGLQFELRPGTQVVISYLLTPPVDGTPVSVGIEGEVHAQQGPDLTITTKVMGSSRLTVVSYLDPLIAVLYLRKEADGSYGLNPPEAMQDLALTVDQLKIVEELMREGKPVPYSGGAVLKPTDYLRLLACYQAGRPVLNCVECGDR